MFISQFSKKQIDANVTPVKVVTKKRPMAYVNHDGKRTFGWEIVEEMLVAPNEVEACQKKHPAPTPVDNFQIGQIKTIIQAPRRREFRERRERD